MPGKRKKGFKSNYRKGTVPIEFCINGQLKLLVYVSAIDLGWNESKRKGVNRSTSV